MIFPDRIHEIRVQSYCLIYQVSVASLLAKEFCEWTEIDDFCPLCQAHPSSGHTMTCPVVLEAVGNGKSLRAIEY
jgi:hypothetical protein